MIDLSQDNRLPALLDERVALKAGIDANTKRLKEIDTEIVAKLSGSDEAALPGWAITNKVQVRKAYTVAETIFAVLRTTRIEAAKLAA